MAKKSLDEIEAAIDSLKSRKSEINGAIKLLNEEVQRRAKMGMDAKEFQDQLKRFDKELADIIDEIPKLTTELYENKRKQDAEFKKKQLKEYLEARVRYYQNALDKLNNKGGKSIGQINPIKHMEAQIAQYNRGKKE